MSAATHLAKFGVSLNAAKQFLLDNLSQPAQIHSVCKQFGVTNAMIAEIVGVPENAVVGFFSSHGLNAAELNGSSQPTTTTSVLSNFPATLSSLITYNTNSGTLSTESLRADIVSKVGQANYSAAFGNSTDAESQAFGTLIRIMKSIDMNEAMQISSFVMQNQAGFAAQDPTVLNNYLNLMGNIYSTPANPQLIPDTLIHTSLVNSFAQMIQVVGSGQSVDWNGVFAGFSGF